LTKTKKVPSSLSNGLVLNGSPDLPAAPGRLDFDGG
jgi:hypothetical protein